MYILGLSSFAHESSCCLIKDGKVVALIEEERLNREKHTWKFPSGAIKECLAIANISLKDIDHVTFFWLPRREIVDNLRHFLRFFPQTIHLFKSPSGSDELSFIKRFFLMQRIGGKLQNSFHLKNKPKIHFVEHHLAHAASSFYVSPFKEAAILTIDGRGESTCTMLSQGRGNTIDKIKEIKVPHSLGHFYATITAYLGFKPFFDEWKVMGMSAYGKDTYAPIFKDMIKLLPQGDYQLNLKYFSFPTHGQAQWYSDYLIKKLGPPRGKEDPYEQRHFDIAYALQKVIEKAGVHLAQYLYGKTQSSCLCLTGGVVLNCLMNKKIVEQTPFKEFFIMPIANDAGTSLGSALYVYHQILNQERNHTFEDIYIGPEYTNAKIEEVLKSKKLYFKKSADISHEAANHVAQGKIVGWFQGRMEAGPRALGNRSIIVDPRDAGMKNRLNERVKRREYFRPFAPSVLEEKVFDFFDMPKRQLSPYMILVGDVREDKKAIIPAVTHTDGTARVHTVNKKTNPRFWQLIHEFGRLTGVPVVLNTSFNENEPIVCTPEDAVNCFLRTEFDVLAIGDYLVTKSETP